MNYKINAALSLLLVFATIGFISANTFESSNETRVLIAEHLCNSEIHNLEDFEALEINPQNNSVISFTNTLLACPIVNSFDFIVDDEYNVYTKANATLKPVQLCENWINYDMNNDGSISETTCIDLSYYLLSNISENITLKDITAGKIGFATFRFIPSELQENNNGQSLLFYENNLIKLNLNDEKTVIIHLYNFADNESQQNNSNQKLNIKILNNLTENSVIGCDQAIAVSIDGEESTINASAEIINGSGVVKKEQLTYFNETNSWGAAFRDLELLKEGNYTFRITANDTFGNNAVKTINANMPRLVCAVITPAVCNINPLTGGNCNFTFYTKIRGGNGIQMSLKDIEGWTPQFLNATLATNTQTASAGNVNLTGPVFNGGNLTLLDSNYGSSQFTLTLSVPANVSSRLALSGEYFIRPAISENQANLTNLSAIMQGCQEVPAVNSNASGIANFSIDTANNIIYFNVNHNSTNQTSAHIHGPAAIGENAGILIPIPTGNNISGNAAYNESIEQDLLNGRTYINIHTAQFPNGEIRGQIMPVPFVCNFTNQTNQTNFTLDISSPLNNSVYNSTSVFVNISSNLPSIFLSFNGFLINYTSPIFTGFSEGQNNLTVIANDSQGNSISKQINFLVNTTQANQTNQTNVTNVTEVGIIDLFYFSPANITIDAGDSVVWENRGLAQHTITSNNSTELNSPIINPGQNYTHTFNTSGEYDYYCSLHPEMKGKVIVR